MANILNDFIEQLKQASHIEEIIAEHSVHLKKSGANYSACCPFHKEKTPSFYVFPKTQTYKCFGCGASGDVIQFIREFLSVDFMTAVKQLAAHHGKELPLSENYQNNSEARAKTSNAIEKIFNCLDIANKFFLNNLKNHKISHQAVDYLKKRGLSGSVAKTFSIGFVEDCWDSLILHFQNKATKDDLIAAGLIIKNENGKFYDRFRNRIIFPIRNIRGKVMGFGGRVINEGNPKYLNSPETKVFDKGKELYGLYEIQKTLKDYSNLIIVEGYLDVISLWQHEIKNSVAILGTSLTTNHIKKLLQLKDEIIFCFDGDTAGQSAAFRALQLSLPFIDGIKQIKFLILPKGLDPDSFIIKKGKNEFLKTIKRSISLLDFMFLYLSKDLDLEHIDGKSKLIARIKPLLFNLQKDYIKQMVLERLAHISGVDKTILGSEKNFNQKDEFNNVPNTKSFYDKNSNFNKISQNTKFNITKGNKKNRNFTNISYSTNKSKGTQKPLPLAIKAAALVFKNRKLINLIKKDTDLFDCFEKVNTLKIQGGKFFLALLRILEKNSLATDDEISDSLPLEYIKHFNPKELISIASIVPEHGIEEEFLGIINVLRKNLEDVYLDEMLGLAKLGELTDKQIIKLQDMLHTRTK